MKNVKLTTIKDKSPQEIEDLCNRVNNPWNDKDDRMGAYRVFAGMIRDVESNEEAKKRN